MPTAQPDLKRRDVAVFLLCLSGTMVALNAAASAWLSDQRPVSRIDRPAQVVGIARDPTVLPPRPGERSMLLLIGNSHTYGLPGLKQGNYPRPETSRTLIDELARRVEPYVGPGNAAFYRLSYPNFLPFEILTTVNHLIYQGFHPDVVVMGWTWGNISRQRELRYAVYRVYRNAEFVRWFTEQLATPDGPENAEILAAIASEVRRARSEMEEEQMQSDADRFDTKAVDWLGQRITLIGGSADLRARLYKNVADAFQDAVVQNIDDYQYGVVESDLAFNLRCMRLVLRQLKSKGVSVLIYYAPQRSDLPSFTENRQEEIVMGDLTAFARQLGFSVVDATSVVPNEYWGWRGQYPDRAHFTEPGHRLLADFLLEKGTQEHVWEALRRPTAASGRGSPAADSAISP